MVAKNYLSGLFGHSPITPLQEHMYRVYRGIKHLVPLIEGMTEVDKAKIIEKGQIAASKDKQKSKSLIEKDTKLYQHIPEPAKDMSFSKGGETKKDGTYYSGANAIKRLASEGNYEQWQLVGEYRAKKVLEKKTLISKKKHVKIYEIIAGTKQSFWMEKGLPKQKKYGKSKHKDADYYTKQDIKGWSEKPLGIIPDTTLKTVPFDLYAKKGRKTVTFQKKKYRQYIIRERSCDSQKIYMAYIKESDIKKYSKHAWKDFVSIKESNPASIGTSAKETLVQTRAEEIKTVPALGRIASKDDDLSDFAKQVLEKIELHKTIENEEIEKEVCLLTGYKKLPTIYDCEQERSKLIRLVCRHPTEWYVTPKKANVLKLNDAQRKEQEALGWWEDAKGVKGLPEPHNVWHFHPAGFVGNLMGGDVYQLVADFLGVEVAAIKAVAKVESSGGGFLAQVISKYFLKGIIFINLQRENTIVLTLLFLTLNGRENIIIGMES